MEEKPPILSDKEIAKALEALPIFRGMSLTAAIDNGDRAIVTAQRNADDEHYRVRLNEAELDGYKRGVVQARAEERKKVLDDIQAGAVSVGDLVEEARHDTAREIFEEIEKITNNPVCKFKNNYLCLFRQMYQSLKDKYLKGKAENDQKD